jgi:hypothetical protein
MQQSGTREQQLELQIVTLDSVARHDTGAAVTIEVQIVILNNVARLDRVAAVRAADCDIEQCSMG